MPLRGSEKARENRLRRLAERQDGSVLSRSRRRDPDAWDYGTYWLAPDPEHPIWIDAHEDDLTPLPFDSLDEVEEFLTSGSRRGQRQRVDDLLERKGMEIDNDAVWLNSKTASLVAGPFYNLDDVEQYLKAPTEQKPAREWIRAHRKSGQ